MKCLVIVESPAKKKKIQDYLNSLSNNIEFIVDASYGHIREFKNGLKSIDFKNNYTPTFRITPSKRNIVKRLRSLQQQCDQVIIATDLDREGEAIGFHIAKVLSLDPQTVQRISFNEITKNAIHRAYQTIGHLNMDLVNAQVARSVLDLLIGYTISPLLWPIRPKLSAGRCQSPALRLVCEKEHERTTFKSKSSFELKAKLKIRLKPNSKKTIECQYSKSISNHLNNVISSMKTMTPLSYTFQFHKKKLKVEKPPPPYITSTIQQDASRLFHMAPKQTMSHLQKLYEQGLITYMRTDSISISKECARMCKEYVVSTYSNKMYVKHVYKSKSKHTQEAHECIRPVHIQNKGNSISNAQQKKLYQLIWRRTVSCFMSSFEQYVSVYHLQDIKKQHLFVSEFFTLKEKGFKLLYDTFTFKDDSKLIDSIISPQTVKIEKLMAFEKMSKPKPRYTEATLVKKLETLGIGRPSTFSSLVNTVLTRGYVVKETKNNFTVLTLSEIHMDRRNKFETEHKKIEKKSQNQKGKLKPTPLGIQVNHFLMQHFKDVFDYEFTHSINEHLDQIAEGKRVWHSVVDSTYKGFHKHVKQMKESKTKSSTPYHVDNMYEYFVDKDMYKTIITRKQEGKKDEVRKVYGEEQQNINKDNVHSYFDYPIHKGTYKGKDVWIKKGPYGLYARINEKNVSIPNEMISLDDIIQIYEDTKKSVLKQWSSGIQIRNGPHGHYIKKGKIIRALPKDKDADKITEKECMDILKTPKPAYKKKKKFNT